MYDVGIVIPLVKNDHYDYYNDLVERRALPSTAQSIDTIGIGVSVSEADTLQEARNRGAEMLNCKWIVFLDADDELDYYFVERSLEGTGDIRQPATVGYTDGDYRKDSGPDLLPMTPLWDGNFLVIGSMMLRSLFLEVDGFDNDQVWEDWCLFCRMYAAGAVIGQVPKAVYQVHTDSHRPGRNESTPDRIKARVMNHVREDVLPAVRRRGWM